MLSDEELPLLSESVAQRGVYDDSGEVIASQSLLTDGDAGFGQSVADFVLHGVWNGAFAQGPPHASQPLGTENPMPYWSGPTYVAGSGITASWEEDATYPSGHVLRFTISAGAADDDAYIEQTVDITGSAYTKLAHRVVAARAKSAGSASFVAYVSTRYLDIDRGEIGTESESTSTLPTSALSATFSAPNAAQSAPASARFLRVRLGVRRSAAGVTETGAIDFVTVHMVRTLGSIVVPDQLVGGTNEHGVIQQLEGALLLVPEGLGTPSKDSPVGIGGEGDGTGYLRLNELASAPATPIAGTIAVYAKTDGRLYRKNDAGVETLIG